MKKKKKKKKKKKTLINNVRERVVLAVAALSAQPVYMSVLFL